MSEAVESTPWKHKYYELLDRLEAEERQWAEAERVLRQAVARLSVAASGIDSRLDEVLQDVRAATRRETDCDRLRGLTERVGDLLPQLDSDARPAAAADRGRPGLLRRLLARRRRDPQAHPSPSPSREGSDSPARVAAQRELLLALAEGTGTEGVGELRRRIEAAPDEAALRELAEQLAKVLHQGEPAGSPPHSGDATPSEVLLALLERLALPGEQAKEVEALKRRLRDGLEPDAWQGTVAAVAELVGQARQQADLEKQQFEAFLAQVTERLADMERFLEAQVSDRTLSSRHGDELTQAVGNEVRSIKRSVHDADDLQELQATVQTRLNTIDRTMREFTDKEAQRIRSADERTADMRNRMRELETETRQLRSAVHERHEQALKDSVTGIANRLAYEERVTEELARSRRFGLPLSLLVWDVDHFKHINDSYGHSAGDKALHKIAAILAERVRETDFVARYGGEEFVMLLTGTDTSAAEAVAEEIRQVVAETPFNYSRDPVDITVSCGIASAAQGDTPHTLFDRADKALYKAKEEGRNRCLAG